MGLDGVEIFTNGSGSHHELRKLYKRVDLIRSATSKVVCVCVCVCVHACVCAVATDAIALQVGGVYMYSNLIGCDGERVYYDGSCLIAINGEVVAQVRKFGTLDVPSL